MSKPNPGSVRLRSELSIPASDQRKAEKGLASSADACFLDLEDSVAAAQKEIAREAAAEVVRHGDWHGRLRTVRINPVGSRWSLRDVLLLFERSEGALQRLIVPKAQTADVVHLDRLLTGLEIDQGRNPGISLEVQIEDPIALAAVDSIVQASPRVGVVTFGQGDFAAASGMPAVDIGVEDEWDRAARGDRWIFARQQIVFAAVRHAIPALNGSYADFRDHEGFRVYCRMSRALGFTGVWCIHPDQIAIANDVFTPTDNEIARARAIVQAMSDASHAGSGAANLDGIMLDEASVRMAERTLALVDAGFSN